MFLDCLTNMVRLVSTSESSNTAESAQLFVAHVVQLHGVPESLISDRGAHFTSNFWQLVCNSSARSAV